MKVILLQDVPKVGKKYEVKEVASGYALNALIPAGRAKEATPSALAELKRKTAEVKEAQALTDERIKKITATLEGKTLTITVPVNDAGHLFAAIHERDVARALREQFSITVSPELVALPAPIKETGVHEITVAGAPATLAVEAKK